MNPLYQQLQGLNLYLIGMMGCGKSTVGELLAKTLNYKFIDTDQLITQVAGQSINTIFAEAGEAEFRQLESQVLSQLCAYQRLVVATGGGIVLQKMNWSYLRHGLIIWLDVPPAQLYQRLQGDTTRPLLQDSDPLLKLQTLLNQRQSLYQQADIRIEVNADDSSSQVMEKVITAIPNKLKSQPFGKPVDQE